ncbi:Ben and cat operon transcriptional regulator [Oligella ureolytica]|uniref:LysR family transcriptional regulator n=1 Tax=Oligella ureolytica TaxID=90244 RepID=UPI000DFA4505|nr:LysR family transcriptional regulator [Oligella ureolytica]SUA54618.1 Ben and cat operon transcriptional regulator [Oligella ureolytica]
MTISLRQMQYFVVVAEEKNMTRASEVLHISQPPLSRQIQQLEESLETKLFVRSSRPLCLTKAGKIFYERSVYILGQIEQLKRVTRQAGQKSSDSISIGFVPSMLYGAFPHLVKRLQTLRPNLEISLVELLSSQQLEALREGEIDIGFGRLRFAVNDISRLVLREERLMVAMSKNHALAGAESDSLPVEALRGESLILYPKDNSPNFSDAVQAVLADYALNIENIQKVSQLQTALGLAAANTGVSIVPESARVSRQDLCYRLLGDESLTSPILAYFRTDDDTELLKFVLSVLVRVYEDKPDWMHYSHHWLTPEGLDF